MSTGFDRLRRTAAPRVMRAIAISLCATSAILVAATGVAAAGDDASRWDGDARSSVRLIAGSPPSGKDAATTTIVRAGVEVKLKPGWHTYWRYPGDAGVPPRFDFAGSQNVKSVDVLWPAPQPIPEQGLIAIGYASDVIWPLAVTPKDRAKPVTLRLKLDYAVCEPAQGKAELVLAGGRSSRATALAEAEARVPRKLALGEGTPLAIKTLRVVREDGRKRPGEEDGATRPRVIVDVAAPSGSAVALFAEGPTPDWALPVPAAIGGAPAGAQRFAFDLDGAPPGAKYQGVPITLTAVAGNSAIEVVARLD
jgi:DsbC/DsbD-like thiol-disulfide interchange protein